MFTELEAGDPRQVGRYRLLARLGAGGMGQVFLARSPGGRELAVKVVRAELAEDAGFRERFASEVTAARRVTGIFTASVVDADPAGSPAWLATEYVPGMSLGQAIAGLGPWPEPAVLALGAGLVEALEAIHGAGVVHRDLKPSNVLLAPDGPRVIDFGISVTDELGGLTRTGVAVGTPGFMAPEQLRTGERAGPASDVFALGGVLAFAATGAGPFGTGAAHILYYRTVHEEPELGQLAPVLRSLVARCLAKEPADRPSPAALLAELSEALRAEEWAAPGSRAGYGWLPPAVAAALRERRPADGGPVPTAGGGAGEVVTAGAGSPGGGGVGAHPPTAVEPPRSPAPGALGATPPPPPSPPQPTPPAAAPARSRRQLLAAAAALGTAGVAFTGWRLIGGGGDQAPGGSGGGHLAPRVGSGTERWSVTDFVAMDTATVADGVLYQYATHGLTEGTTGLYALNTTDGTTRWFFPSEARVRRPAVADGTVYLTARDDALYALDAADGQRRWRFTDDQAPATGPAVAGDTVYVGGGLGRLHAVDAASGERRWSYRYPWEDGSVPAPPPVIADGTVYLGADDGTLHAVDAATGRERWTHLAESGYRVFSPAAVAGDTVYFSCGNGQVYAVGTVSGERRWAYPAGEGQPSGPVVADGTVYVHDFSDQLHAVDAASGERRWGYPLGTSVYLDPAVGEGTVCLATLENTLHALDAETGRERWTFTAVADSESVTEPVIADGTVYYTVRDVYRMEHFVLHAVAL
ncbi:serine/threonine-protein kinase [Streptomyces sp. DSM 44915]|uniref:Serine/threonine-protein kinase n=1 Tax=Streptomyces chisholmiae TaxID=3075540 RepID=A0ABU2JMA3_9ACTN|nr:serine/threonine-protein kinase [Streptomyces sp. DSM 44915]MDT0265858.1 serine/threonine-protein kinase [Streptomyces sp. DSM 44915]